MEEGIFRYHYVKKYIYILVFGSNKDVVAASLINLHGKNTEESDKQDVVTNIEFEAIVPIIKISYFTSAWLIF